MCQARLEELHRLWDLLMKRLAERGRRLQLALDLLQYLREAEDLLYWISDKRNFVERQDLGRDLEHLEQIQVIVKKFEEFLQVRTRPDQWLPTLTSLSNSSAVFVGLCPSPVVSRYSFGTSRDLIAQAGVVECCYRIDQPFLFFRSLHIMSFALRIGTEWLRLACAAHSAQSSTRANSNPITSACNRSRHWYCTCV